MSFTTINHMPSDIMIEILKALQEQDGITDGLFEIKLFGNANKSLIDAGCSPIRKLNLQRAPNAPARNVRRRLH